MRHYGDIKKISGFSVPIVDIITGGSPCQDLSIAGKRAGLDGERSGLFMEQIRIIKEMRENYVRTNDNRGLVTDPREIKPRYLVWENVVGALNSPGKDKVGEDFRRVLEEVARVVESDTVIPRPPKKWTKSGAVVGNGWSIAWRVHDAQFWGVPQRRKRVALVADFGGYSAGEILFERNGVQGHTTESGETRTETTGATCERVTTSSTFRQSRYGGYDTGVGVLRAKGGDFGGGSETLVIQNKTYQNITGTLTTCYRKNTSNEIASNDLLIAEKRVRRLTPKECTRLQGFPDDWLDIGDTWTDTNGKTRKVSDAQKYTALGNSIALPFWQYLAIKMVGQLDGSATMASLFDGIGGFPLVFQRAGCIPVWASEIEEFPIAVTKYHFGEQ